MKKTTTLAPLFKRFIRDTETGKRLKKNGTKIQPQSIDNYRYVLRNLLQYQELKGVELRVCEVSKLTQREYKSEKNYWKKFYKNYTAFLYKKGCHDNYVGANMKVIRTFFGYLKRDLDLQIGEFYKQFYVRHENVSIHVLSPDQLKLFIHDTAFETQLTPSLLRAKDMFVFGCATGLRFSDLACLTNKNFERHNDEWYFKIRSKKTKTFSFVKLPSYAHEIYLKYRSKSNKQLLFKPIALMNFNKHLKELGRRAGFDNPIQIEREKRGKLAKGNKKEMLFYQKMSSHMMRRTAITTHLILGMPEHLVKQISGHGPDSASFYRYVHYAQSYMDKEIDKVHQKLETY